MESLEESEWTRMMNLFLSENGGATFSPVVYYFENEVKTSRYIQGSETIRNVLTSWLEQLTDRRCFGEDLSDDFRNRGNVFFRNPEKINEATLMYTKAIYTAPTASGSLALAHGNRAAALYKLGEYEAAYYDCECALKLNHPKPEKILLRQATSARSLRDQSKLENCIGELGKLNINNKILQIDENCSVLNKLTVLPENCREQPTGNNLSEHIVEKKQKIIRSEKCGRYVVADEPIAINEIIMTEEPFAFVPVVDGTDMLFDDLILRYTCDSCAEKDIVPFPCYVCRNVFYCSPNCRHKHYDVHRMECAGYKVGLFCQVGIAHLAFRSLLLTFNKILDELNRKKDTKMYKAAEDLWPEIVQMGNDGDLMGLCTNFKIFEDKKDLIRYALTASMLCCYLKSKSDFFDQNKEIRLAVMDSDLEWQIIVTALLLRMTNQMICNAHTYESLLVTRPFGNYSSKDGEICARAKNGDLFSAIYPRVSLYNHSCEPNFRNKFVKGKLIVIATKAIGKGEEIYNCYLKNSKSMSRNNRRASLQQQYGFTCHCECCEENANDKYARRPQT